MDSGLEPMDKHFEQMMQMLTGFWVTQIIGAVAMYSLGEHLAKGPATAEQIAASEGIDPIATFRLLRACASLGLVTFHGTRFTATPLLGTLQKDAPGSLHSLAIALAAPGHWQPWGRFFEAIRTGGQVVKCVAAIRRGVRRVDGRLVCFDHADGGARDRTAA